MGIRRRRGVRPGAGGSVPGQIDSASGWGGGGGFVLGKDPNTDVRVPYVVNVLSCAEASVFLPHLINLITSHPPPPLARYPPGGGLHTYALIVSCIWCQFISCCDGQGRLV